MFVLQMDKEKEAWPDKDDVIKEPWHGSNEDLAKMNNYTSLERKDPNFTHGSDGLVSIRSRMTSQWAESVSGKTTPTLSTTASPIIKGSPTLNQVGDVCYVKE